MSDFDAVFTDPEESTTPEPEAEAEPTPDEPVEAEATPEPEPLWKRAGFDSEEAYEKKVLGLSNWEKDLQRKSSKLGAQKEQVPVAPPVNPDGDIFEDLDPAYADKFRRAIQQEAAKVAQAMMGTQAKITDEMFQGAADQLFSSFAEKNDLSSDELYEFMDTYDLLPSTPSLKELETKLDLAGAALKGRNLDSIVDQRLAEKLDALKAKGGEVKAVEPASTPEPKSTDDEDDTSELGFSQLLKRFR